MPSAPEPRLLPFSGNAVEWNKLVSRLPLTAPEQSWEWGAAIEEFGWSTERLLFLRGDAPIGAASVQLRRKFGQAICIVPRGPLLDYSLQDTACTALSALRTHYRNALFIKINPLVESVRDFVELCSRSGFHQTQGRQDLYSETIEIDLAKSEEELFRSLRSRSRSGIRAAEKELELRTCSAADFLPRFAKLHAQMSEIKGLGGVTPSYFEHFANHLEAPGTLVMRGAFQGGDMISGLILLRWHDALLYKWGATDRLLDRTSYASQLLHWDTILWAKKSGIHSYDLGGIDEKRNPGVTNFKMGFGGTVKKYAGEFDAVNRPMLYWLYQILHK